MKKMLIAILVCITNVGNKTVCMESEVPHRVIDLMDPAQVKQNLEAFLTGEANGQFSYELLGMETILINEFKENSLKKFRKIWNKETFKLATLVSERPAQRNQLFSAIKEDNPDKLEKIINGNPYMLNAYNAEQKTVLHNAVLWEKKQCVKRLLRLQANPNCVDDKGHSPLHTAIKNEAPIDIIEDLLTAGAQDDIASHAGKTPFDLACEQHSSRVEAFEKRGYLFFSALRPYKNPAALLKDNGHLLHAVVNGPIGSLEWEAAQTALEKLFEHIDISNSFLSCINYTNKSAIDSLAPKALINRNGLILHNACTERCELLFGKDVLDYAKNLIRDIIAIKDFLLSAAKNNKPHDELKNVLKKYSISSGLQYTILKTCIEYNNMEGLSICLAYGFNPNRYHRGLSLLHHAVYANSPTAIFILAEHNADFVPYTDLSHFGTYVQTPLDYAVSQKNQLCIIAMAQAIKQRISKLLYAKNGCGLVKHILNKTELGTCEECIKELVAELKKHDLEPKQLSL